MPPMPPMPSIMVRDIRLEMTTTTVYADLPTPTTASQQGNGANKVPTGVIVGATGGGALLAVLMVVAWKVCKRSMKRKRTRERWNEEALRVTKENTRQNTIPGSSKSRSHSPIFWAPTPTKVKFAAPNEIKNPSTSTLGITEKSLHSKGTKGKGTAENAATVMPSKPRPLKSSKRAEGVKTASPSHQSSPSPVTVPLPSPPPLPPRVARLPHRKPSNISSRSYYSLESGEDHNGSRTGSRFYSVLSALGNVSDVAGPRSSGGGNRMSVSSSLWSFLSRNSRGERGPPTRLSQASSTSAYSQPEESVVGLAC
ncbi:hypothetical protein Moror_17116 [Moniliophthora roreri MCA 2997]|uniref:Uncharacterized protein n=2 Tax=Moniliophthora roreri TaxID=221103 RepID=V2X4P7_MONRO|nr:hypothetical protein Moror_17116 [Moniliophthora roreri MCA 2997]KAI3604782.1 hypothetical protein WG66_008585 [Moniliophthora roreri]